MRICAKGFPRNIVAALSLAILMAPTAPVADEFDELLAIEEAKPLNDEWQRCAASFARSRLNTNLPAERLAERALNRCSSQAAKLTQFLSERIGEKSARGVIASLREKYSADLAGVITQLRKRD